MPNITTNHAITYTNNHNVKKRYCLSCIAPSDGLHEQTLFCGGVRS